MTDSFTSMKTKLEATGLYRVLPNSNIYAELKAYAEGTDILFQMLDKMLCELFICTASDYGISERELLIGRQRDNFDLEKRREMLTINEQSMDGKCTLQAFEMILKGCGVDDFEILEYPNLNRAVININESIDEITRQYIDERVRTDFPAHLDVVVNEN